MTTLNETETSSSVPMNSITKRFKQTKETADTQASMNITKSSTIPVSLASLKEAPCCAESPSSISMLSLPCQTLSGGSVYPLSQQQIDSVLWNEAKYLTSKSSMMKEATGATKLETGPSLDGSAEPRQETATAASATSQSNSPDLKAVIRKRKDYLSWDDYFMAVAALSAMRSKDPVTPTGACIVDERQRIVGIGYNGFPRGCSDDLLPWKTTTTSDDASKESSVSMRLPPSMFVVHAEVNAILNKCSADVANCRLYCQRFPCHDCAKMIIQSRIRKILYSESGKECCHDANGGSNCDDGEYDDARTSLRASRILLSLAGVEMIQLKPSRPMIDLDLVDMRQSTIAVGDEEGVATNAASIDELSVNERVTQLRRLSTSTTIDESHRQLLLREANYDPLLHPPTRRPNVLSWDDYFTSMAVLTAQRSKDPNTQVGACLVDDQKRIIGLGYNGFPSGCSDDDLPWARHATNSLHCKYPYVCHAEMNAILNKGSADVRGATLFVALFPCNECAKVTVQAGVREVVYVHDFYHDTDACRASRIMFTLAGVKLRRHVPAVARIRLGLELECGCVDAPGGGK
ncbi:hypothetical protein MPSEU_001092300 [Mayamaea pseudoterrestris]|nr:hypothetical protein MPSEU_000287100 [Mayamaea pseudoterrestris]GKZ01415.1 hypothetical protein MPSEU_001092300 [Mayamaea pseudoterrestris]